MRRLMTAEWYRLRHSGNFLWLLLAAGLLIFLMPASSGTEWLNGTVVEGLQNYADVFLLYGTFLGTFIGLCVGMPFDSHLAYYEVMDGHKTLHILLSKLVVYCSIFMAELAVLFTGYFTFLGCRNGMGELSLPVLRFAMLAVSMLRILCVSVLIPLCLRKIAAAGLIYLRFMLAMTAAILAQEVFLDNQPHLLCWFLSRQFTALALPTYGAQEVTAVLISSVLEVGLLFGIAFYGYRKRKF